MQAIILSITAAIQKQGRIEPAVQVSQKVSAGNQVLVSWTVSRDATDKLARSHVRTDAIIILGIVKASKLHYDSVLLVATGAILVQNKKKESVVVRAKYTSKLVKATNWAKISEARIFVLPDDKPAVIAPSFR